MCQVCLSVFFSCSILEIIWKIDEDIKNLWMNDFFFYVLFFTEIRRPKKNVCMCIWTIFQYLRKQAEQYWNENLCVKCLFLCEGIKISYERRSMKMSLHAGRIINDLLQCANFKRKYFQAKAIKIGKNTIFIFFKL